MMPKRSKLELAHSILLFIAGGISLAWVLEWMCIEDESWIAELLDAFMEPGTPKKSGNNKEG
jgi:hypothetical protein